MKSGFLRWLFVLGLFIAWLAPRQMVSAVQAADSRKEDKPPVVKLVLHPAAEPRPALKYRLFPPLSDRRPGNAAVLYGKVTAEQRQFFGNQELWEKIVEWIDLPLEELPKKQVRNSLPSTPFKFLDRAARRESIDWELPIWELATRGEPYYTVLLPEVQETRGFGRMLAAKARLHIAEGDFDEAVHTLQTGYALGRHVGQGQTLVNGLVGIAIARMMSKQVETLAQQPGAPNLYWALTHLPEPLVDMRPGFEAEWAVMYLSYPELRDLESKDYPPEKWRELLDKIARLILQFEQSLPEPIYLPALTALGLKGYPVAKQALIERGYEAAEVEAMPVAKVLLLDTMRTYEELRDEMFKWFPMPYWEVRQRIDEAERKLREYRYREVIPIATVLLPAIQAAHFAGARSQRTIAVLRVIEAIRLYGASHDAELPEKLSDITDVPVPIDPTTGDRFIYQRTGKTAVLESPGGEHYGLRYEITFAPKGK